MEIRRHRGKVESGKRNSDEEMKKEVCSSEEVKENIEIKEEQPNNEKSERSKNVYCKVDVSKKLELATYCRAFRLEKNRNPMCKELKNRLP